MTEIKPPERLFPNRRETCSLLGNISLPILQEFVDEKLLTPIRLSGRDQGRVYFERKQIMSLRDQLVAGLKRNKKNTTAKIAKTKRRA